MSQADMVVAKRIRYWAGIGLACSSVLISSGSQASDLFRWTDSKGTVHFTDKPPKGIEVEKLTLEGPAVAAAEPDETVEDEATTQANTHKAERCTVERERLSTLQNSQEIRMRENDGSVRVLSDEEIKNEIRLSNQAISLYCNS